MPHSAPLRPVELQIRPFLVCSAECNTSWQARTHGKPSAGALVSLPAIWQWWAAQGPGIKGAMVPHFAMAARDCSIAVPRRVNPSLMIAQYQPHDWHKQYRDTSIQNTAHLSGFFGGLQMCRLWLCEICHTDRRLRRLTRNVCARLNPDAACRILNCPSRKRSGRVLLQL